MIFCRSDFYKQLFMTTLWFFVIFFTPKKGEKTAVCPIFVSFLSYVCPIFVLRVWFPEKVDCLQSYNWWKLTLCWYCSWKLLCFDRIFGFPGGSHVHKIGFLYFSSRPKRAEPFPSLANNKSPNWKWRLGWLGYMWRLGDSWRGITLWLGVWSTS